MVSNFKALSILASSLLAVPAIMGTTVASADDSAAAAGPTNSQAKFTVSVPNDSDGSLTLNTVPNFDFGTTKSSEIYGGFNGKTGSVDNPIQVTDNRANTGNGWKLSIARDNFTGLQKNSVLSLKSDPATNGGDQTYNDVMLNGDSDDQGNAITVSSKYRGVSILKIKNENAQLKLGANPLAKITDGQTLTSNITWTIGPDVPAEPVNG